MPVTATRLPTDAPARARQSAAREDRVETAAAKVREAAKDDSPRGLLRALHATGVTHGDALRSLEALRHDARVAVAVRLIGVPLIALGMAIVGYANGGDALGLLFDTAFGTIGGPIGLFFLVIAVRRLAEVRRLTAAIGLLERTKPHRWNRSRGDLLAAVQAESR